MTTILNATQSFMSNSNGVGKTNVIRINGVDVPTSDKINFNPDETVLTVSGVEYQVTSFAGNVQLLKTVYDAVKALPTDKLHAYIKAVTAGFVSPSHETFINGGGAANPVAKTGKLLTAIEYLSNCFKTAIPPVDLLLQARQIDDKTTLTKKELAELLNKISDSFVTDTQLQTYNMMLEKEQAEQKAWQELIEAGFTSITRLDDNRISAIIAVQNASAGMAALTNLNYLLSGAPSVSDFILSDGTDIPYGGLTVLFVEAPTPTTN